MRKLQKPESSGKPSPLLEWQTCDSDTEWQAQQQETLTNPLPRPSLMSPLKWMRHWRIGAAIFLVLATGVYWTWSTAERGIAQLETELRERVELDLLIRSTQEGSEIHNRSITAQSATLRPLSDTVHLLGFPGETAIVQTVTQAAPDQPSLRQTHFYQQTSEGWQRTKPDANLWGSSSTLESSHFIFHFRHNDAQVVSAVAPQMDKIYTDLQHNFGLISDGEKLVIEVTVEERPGKTLAPQWTREPLVVASPALYLAPIDLTEDAILAQSIALPLVAYMGQRAIKDHAIPYRWRELLRGLQLGQLWHLEMPLAHWRQDLVQWLYFDPDTATVDQEAMLPANYADLCAMHHLWMQSPMEIWIPLGCTDSDTLLWSPSQWAASIPRTRSGQLDVPVGDWEIPGVSRADDPYNSSEALVIATLFEYVAELYGAEQMPVLLASLAQYDDWQTLLPAVFGVSAPNFEAGWRSYLDKRYDLSLDH